MTNAIPAPTPAEIRQASLEIMQAVLKAIRDLKTVPTGELYALVMDFMDLASFTRMTIALVETGMVRRQGHQLVWVDPDREVAPPSRAVVPGLAEIEAACEAEGTPLRVQTEEVNLGGRCSECGYTYGHRMDCCFI